MRLILSSNLTDFEDQLTAGAQKQEGPIGPVGQGPLFWFVHKPLWHRGMGVAGTERAAGQTFVRVRFSKTQSPSIRRWKWPDSDFDENRTVDRFWPNSS